jgi:hypothetical protein
LLYNKQLDSESAHQVLAVLALVALSSVLADARSPALFAGLAQLAVLADARSPALFAALAVSFVLADARSPALFAAGALSFVLADALTAALLAIIGVGAVGALVCRFALPPGTLLLGAILALLWQALLLGDSLALL